jgi:integrase
MVILGIRSGLRISELLSLRICDTFSGGNPRDRIYLKRRNTKGRHQGASLILHSQAVKAIAKWLSIRKNVGPQDWLFPSQMRPDRPLGRKSAWALLHRAFVEAGVEGMAGTHCLRKTACARIYRALKGDIFRLSIAMRHSSPLTTMAYLSFRQEGNRSGHPPRLDCGCIRSERWNECSAFQILGDGGELFQRSFEVVGDLGGDDLGRREIG